MALTASKPVPVADGPVPCDVNLGDEVERLERSHIVRALKEHNGVQQQASRVLGLTPRQLGYRIKKYGIDLREI
jgi:Nif-specific regulatory protein